MAKKPSTTPYPADEENLLIFDEDGDYRGSSSSAPIEDVQNQVKVAQEELIALRLRQEEIQRQQERLAAIGKKQAAFATGKRESLERLSRSVSAIERDLYDNQKLTEELTATLDTFQRHVEVLRSIQPEKWPRHQADEELDLALEAIDDAEEDFEKATRRLENLRPATAQRRPGLAGKTTASDADDPVLWFKRGLAFTLPLIATLIIGLLLVRLLF